MDRNLYQQLWWRARVIQEKCKVITVYVCLCVRVVHMLRVRGIQSPAWLLLCPVFNAHLPMHTCKYAFMRGCTSMSLFIFCAGKTIDPLLVEREMGPLHTVLPFFGKKKRKKSLRFLARISVCFCVYIRIRVLDYCDKNCNLCSRVEEASLLLYTLKNRYFPINLLKSTPKYLLYYVPAEQ